MTIISARWRGSAGLATKAHSNCQTASRFFISRIRSIRGVLVALSPGYADDERQKIPSTSHAWAVQHASWNGGKMDNWLPAHRKAEGEKAPFVMGYHTRADIPFQFALAESFTICDAYHCSVMGPDVSQPHVLDDGDHRSGRRAGGPVIHNHQVKGGFRWTTYAERLQKAGVSWKVYQQQDNYGCNMLEYFQTFQRSRPGFAPV